MTNSYYNATAHDSTRPRDIAPADNSHFGMTTRKLREAPLGAIGTHCKEYLAQDHAEVIELLNDDTSDARKQLEANGHEAQPWQTFGNPLAVIRVITGVIGFILFFGGGGALLTEIVQNGLFSIFNQTTIIILGPFLALYLLGKLILRFNLVKDKNNVWLNRHTGMITIPQKKGATLELPFDEFDPYLTTATNPTGSTDFYLQLGHRFSETRVQYPPNMPEPWQAYLAWEYWQQYMDISQPLPDTPRMEPYRSRDPVTAEHDAKYQRPADYWKTMDVDLARAMKLASIKAAAAYPWGATRQQALALGWRPSGVGEGNLSEKAIARWREMLAKKDAVVESETWAGIEKRGDFEEP
jgi:hypothetical protein